MASSFRTLRRALRSNNRNFALLVLNELLGQQEDCWAALYVRARLHAEINNLVKAISDSTKALQVGSPMSDRNRARILAALALYAQRLAGDQRGDLREKFREDPVKARRQTTAQVGRIAAIGKFLFDQKDLVKLENLVTKASAIANVRRLMPESVEDLDRLLSRLCHNVPSITGACVFGRDGFLLTSALPPEYRSDLLGAQLLGHYLIDTENPQELESGGQIAVASAQGYVILADCDSDVVVIITNERDPHKLSSLHNNIRTVLTHR